MDKNNKKIILCGYNWAGCKALELLLNRNYEVFVYTHESPWHVNNLIEFCNQKKVKFSTEKITLNNLPFVPNIITSIFYRYIIDEEVINIVNKKIFNLHPSLLPEYKGCSSLTWAIVNGETNCGFTYHYIEKEVDKGNIILQVEEKIYEFDTQQSLYSRIMFKSLEYFNEVLDMVIANNPGKKQPIKGSFYKRGCPHNGELNIEWDTEKQKRFIKAMIHPPLDPAKYKGKNIFSFDDLENI